MLTTTTQMFQKAYKGGYAIGGFNVNNMEIVQGIMEAARNKKSAVILQVSAGARKYANPIFLKYLVQASVEVYPEVPVSLHLDHGDSFEICKDCIDGGFTSVMIDASHHDLAENIEITKKVVEYAHSKGVVVEAELGRLAGVEDDVNVSSADSKFTQVEDAVRFVKETGCDSLAIAIGTSHGAFKFKGEPFLDFQRLDEITKAIPNFPLVLHGASTVLKDFVDMCNKYGGNVAGAKGVPEDMISKAAKSGVCKINIDTDIRLAMTATIRKYLNDQAQEYDPRKYLGEARKAVQQMVEHKIDILGSTNSI